MITSDTDMGYYLLLTTASSHHYLYFYLLVPHTPSDIQKPRFWKQFYAKELISQRVYLPHTDYFKGKLETCSVYFFVYLSPLFELICQFQPNLTESLKLPKMFYLLYSHLSSSRTTWTQPTKLWKTTCLSSAAHKTARRFLWHLVAGLCQSEVPYIGIKALPTDKVHFHLGN